MQLVRFGSKPKGLVIRDDYMNGSSLLNIFGAIIFFCVEYAYDIYTVQHAFYGTHRVK